MYIKQPNSYNKIKSLLGIDQLPINDLPWQVGLRKIHPRVRVSNLGHGILKPSGISVSNIVGELRLGLIEKVILAD